MNRSVERRELPTRGTTPHQLQVGTFRHPERGLVRCSAAEVLAASLRRTGHDAVYADRTWEVDADAPDGVLFTASYLDRENHAVGFCVAAHASDETGLQAARDVVNTWSAVWRTRRVVVAPRSTTCCDDAQHPCHHIMAARAEMRAFSEQGDQVVVIGQRGHTGLTSLLHGMPAEVVVAGPDDRIGRMQLDPDRVSYVVQPGMLIEDAAQVVAALRAHYPRIRGAHPDGLCYATSDHAATVGVIAATCDVTFILGQMPVPAVLGPFMLPAAEKTRVRVIDDIAQIRPAWIAGGASVGIVPAPLTPPDLEHELLDLLSGLGPLSVVRRRLTTEVLSSWRTPADSRTSPALHQLS